MRPKPLPFNYRLGLAALVVLLMAAAASGPYLADGAALRQHLLTRLAAWTGGEVNAAGPLRIRGFLALTAETGPVDVTGIKALGPVVSLKAQRIEVSIDWLDLLFGRTQFKKLILQEPLMVFGKPGDSGTPAGNELSGLQPLLRSLEGGPFAEVVLRKGDILFAAEDGKPPRRLQNIDTRLVRSRHNGRLTGKGGFTWNGQAVSFGLRKDSSAAAGEMVTAPVKLTLQAPLGKAVLTGEAALGPQSRLKGKIDLTTADWAAAASWLEMPPAWEPEAKAFSAAGNFSWSSGEIAIENAALRINGSRAAGSFLLKYNGPRPYLEGTLAFQDLNLTPYLSLRQTLFPAPAHGGIIAAIAAADITAAIPSRRKAKPLPGKAPRSWLHRLDADIRISAGSASLNKITAGPAALTLSLKSAKLAAEFAELMVMDGSVRGHFELDGAGAEPKLSVRATAEDIDAAQLLNAAGLDNWLEGDASINFEGRASGSSMQAILQSLNGRAKIAITEGGRIGLDPFKLITQASASAIDGWVTARPGQITFDALRGELLFGKGNIYAKAFELVCGQGSLTAKGTIQVAQQALEWQISSGDNWGETKSSARKPQTGERAKIAPQTLVIEGPWLRPRIYVKGRPAAAPPESGGERRSQMPPGLGLNTIGQAGGRHNPAGPPAAP